MKNDEQLKRKSQRENVRARRLPPDDRTAQEKADDDCANSEHWDHAREEGYEAARDHARSKAEREKANWLIALLQSLLRRE